MHHVPSDTTSIRLPRDMLASLKELAHRKSIQERRDISWTSVVKQVVEDHLLNREPKGGTSNGT
jgi:hypothetical protein